MEITIYNDYWLIINKNYLFFLLHLLYFSYVDNNV